MTTSDDTATSASAARDDLVAHLDAYLHALVANDPGSIAARGARFTENGQELPLGKGLWATATLDPPPERQLALADPATGQAACFALVHEAGEPVLLALRLLVRDGAVAEAETLVCRDRDMLFSLDGFRRPRPVFDHVLAADERSSRQVLAGIPDRYLDGILAADGGAIPVSDDCIRIENGVQTVLNPDAVGIRAEARDRGTWHLGVAAQVSTGVFGDIEAARDRRVLVVDEDLGAVLVWFAFDHAGPVTARGGESRFRTPNSMMAAEVFKVVDGEIREIEAVLDVFPYGMRPGWDDFARPGTAATRGTSATTARRASLPSYDELPVAPGAPRGSSWGLWGPDDVLGCLNLLTPDKAREGVASVTDGAVFNLNLELELPDPPLFGRAAAEHIVRDLGTVGHDDLLSNWNTQRSSQWDGFRHVKHPAYGFYNGVDDERHGIHHWARRGLVTRGVLADVARWRASAGRPIVPGEPDTISIDDVVATLDAQGSPVLPGDILLLRTGWLGHYRTLGEEARKALGQTQGLACCGLERGVKTVAGLWDLHPAAVAADNPGLEVMPAGPRDDMARWLEEPELAADSMLHFCLLGLLGLPIGELFQLDALARHCEETGRYAFLFTSAPLNLDAGVATPPNALAVT